MASDGCQIPFLGSFQSVKNVQIFVVDLNGRDEIKVSIELPASNSELRLS